ncbi:MAG: AraC family transcriptional regulator [Bacteroidota bacterium]|nr:AraC family transcriptional regulator [Bacteroidota bacterium]MDP4205702.1 AraC family transcriptional regulator [Bacteroidota bacterium]
MYKQNYFKYLTAGEDDINWGMYITVTGVATTLKNSEYPSREHPNGYYFTWSKGRILQEYQILYITEGSGIFENKYGNFKVNSGDVIILFPGEWHRYCPNKQTGWKEHYLGFNGAFAENILSLPPFSKEEPVLSVGFNVQLLDLYCQVIETVHNERAGYQQICAGITMTILAQINALIKYKDFEGKEVELKVRKACIFLRENLDKQINVEEIAEKLNIGYSHFRKMFKKYTGLSPVQYHFQLRMKHAYDMLVSTDKSVKMIAYDLGFQSLFYFTKVFKQKTGMTPTDVRKMNKKQKEETMMQKN